jgi:hypothetical protein
LEDVELDAATQMGQWLVMRPWTLWVKEVEAGGLYVNTAE